MYVFVCVCVCEQFASVSNLLHSELVMIYI